MISGLSLYGMGPFPVYASLSRSSSGGGLCRFFAPTFVPCILHAENCLQRNYVNSCVEVLLVLPVECTKYIGQCPLPTITVFASVWVWKLLGAGRFCIIVLLTQQAQT